MPDRLIFEKKALKNGYSLVLGLDEAGRGPLAGPVVAAAVCLRQTRFKNKINDSKLLTPAQREAAMHEISRRAYVGVGVMNESVIDEANIAQATYAAMTNAVWHLIHRLPQSRKKSKSWHKKIFLLVDGKHFRSDMPFARQTVVRGDSLSLSVACASIVAKVTRDRIMKIYDSVYPQYRFHAHKGYPTEKHIRAIRSFGPAVIHRKTFKGVC